MPRSSARYGHMQHAGTYSLPHNGISATDVYGVVCLTLVLGLRVLLTPKATRTLLKIEFGIGSVQISELQAEPGTQCTYADTVSWVFRTCECRCRFLIFRTCECPRHTQLRS